MQIFFVVVLAYLTFSMTRTPKYDEKIMLKNSKHDIIKINVTEDKMTGS